MIILVAAISMVGAWAILHPLDAAQLFWRALSWLFNSLTRRYSKAAVEKNVNAFLATRLTGRAGINQFPLLHINWVTEASDARLHEDGGIVVRLRHERDPSRNTLMAVATAAPQLLFPHARPYMRKELVGAIDLEVLRLLADLLGGRAHHILSTEILSPALDRDPRIRDLLPVLFEIQKSGLFGQVLLQELIVLSERFGTVPAPTSLAGEITDFVHWLHGIAIRAPGDESGSLNFLRSNIRTQFILAAKADTAAHGTGPYERRLSIALAQGARTIYLVGLNADHTPLCEAIGYRFDVDPRVTRVRSVTIEPERNGSIDRTRLIQFRRNDLQMPEGSFEDHLATAGVRVGDTCEAVVYSLEADRAFVRIGPLEAVLRGADAAWGYRGTVRRFVAKDERLQVQVLSVDNMEKQVAVGLKQLSPSPWLNGEIPTERARVRVTLIEHFQQSWIVQISHLKTDSRDAATAAGESPRGVVFGRIPSSEWSWFSERSSEYIFPQIGQSYEAEVLGTDSSRDDILLSRRITEVGDWGKAKKKYATGTQWRATVVDVGRDGIRLLLEPGVFGRIPEHRIREAGFEMKDFEDTVVPGAKYDVVITGAKEKRRDFRLSLARTSLSSARYGNVAAD